MSTRFEIRLEHYKWNCGDGCCSYSGFKMEVLDTSTGLLVDDEFDWECHRTWGGLFRRAIEKISEFVDNPLENIDYTIMFVETTSDGEEYEAYDLAWLKD